MESAEKVRLVRCPKCQNVLPELPDYSVYQCGGCGAVLRAKGEFLEDELVPERCHDESIGAVCETLERCSGATAAPLGIVAIQDIEPGVGSLSLDQRSSEESIRDSKPGVGETKDRSDKRGGVDAQNVNTPGISHYGEDGGFRFQSGCNSELQKSEPVSGWRKSGAGNVVGSLKNGCGESCGVRFLMSKYPDEGPSDCNFTAMYDSREALPGKHSIIDGGGRGVHLLERDREELLRKLDELKNQLSQSYDIGSTTREGLPVNGSTVCRDTFGNSDAHSPVISSMSREQFDANRHGAGLPYFGQYPNSLPHTNRQDLMHNSDPSIHSTNHYPGFCNHYVTQMHRSCPGPYDRVLPHGLISGQYLDPSCDPFGPVPTASIPHQSTCACFHCVNNHGQASAPVPPSAFSREYPNVSPIKSLHYFEHPGVFGSSYIGPRYAVPPLISHLRRSRPRLPSELKSEGLMHCLTHRAVSFDKGCRSRPVAGGAPFLTCSCCFELLQVPRKVPSKAKKQGKIQCGACSALISYDLTKKKLVFSAQTVAKEATAEDGDSSCEVIKGGYVQSHGYITGASNTSDDFDNSGYDCLSSERPRVPSTGCNNMSLTNSLEMESISPSISDQENNPSGLDNSGDSLQQAMNAKHSPPPPGSQLQVHFDHSSRDHTADHFGKGNRSNRSNHEKVLSSKTALRQNSLQEATLATEMEMSFNEFSDNTVSGDSGDANGDHDRPRGNKGESFLSNIFKKSFKDLSRSGPGEERGKGKVYVNGHLIPDRLIKKAEKLTGPIQAGKYWYDFRAGFWGVMSGPCLGIIPPYIKEFNYPMKENCAGGDTGVSVNGRELHKKDLDLLASRGLPTDRDRSYIIEISGRVYDEDSGEELDCLGKLAPTVEKAKHGFGMRAPKAADT